MGLPLSLATYLSWVGPPSNLGGGSARAVFLLVSQVIPGARAIAPHPAPDGDPIKITRRIKQILVENCFAVRFRAESNNRQQTQQTGTRTIQREAPKQQHAPLDFLRGHPSLSQCAKSWPQSEPSLRPPEASPPTPAGFWFPHRPSRWKHGWKPRSLHLHPCYHRQRIVRACC